MVQVGKERTRKINNLVVSFLAVAYLAANVYAIVEMTTKLTATTICFIAFIVSTVGCATPNRLGLLALSEQWRRPSRRHCLLYRIKCALVCESLKTVLDVSTFLDAPSLRVETILRLPEVRRRS